MLGIFRAETAEPDPQTQGSINRHCGRAKQLFRAALRKRLIAENPFADMRDCVVKANKARECFISRADAEKIIAACPDPEWRLIFALARFGGLRTPSETLSLRWGDVDWERGRLLVRSPKTEHHEGKESRWVPIFPELRPLLDAAFDRAAEGAEHVITRYRDGNANLRTQLLRIISRAGLTAWPKLFQNLRSTRETELAESFPIHVVTAWLGNSQLVATKHYLQVTDDHFQKAAHIPAHNTAEKNEIDGKSVIRPLHDNEKGPEFQCLSVPFRLMRNLPVPTQGAELSQESSGKSQVAARGVSKSGSLGGKVDPRLAQLIEVWPGLSADVKAEILMLATTLTTSTT